MSISLDEGFRLRNIVFLSHTEIVFQVSESLFPCALSKEITDVAEEAVQLAVKTWGQRSLTELEAEERLSYSCEKVKLMRAVIRPDVHQ